MDEVFGPGYNEGLYYDFRVDPYEPNRVWFVAGLTASHQGGGGTIFGDGTGTVICSPPQTLSLSFNKDEKVTCISCALIYGAI